MFRFLVLNFSTSELLHSLNSVSFYSCLPLIRSSNLLIEQSRTLPIMSLLSEGNTYMCFNLAHTFNLGTFTVV